MSNKNRYILGVTFWSFMSTALAVLNIYTWLKGGEIEGWLIFILSLNLYYLLDTLTWGGRENGQKEDELDTHIKAESSRITYPFLMISSVVIYYFFSDNDNYPLLAVIALIFVARPLFEFIYSRKFK